MLHSVSIIIPTYNGDKFIQKTVDSCLNQSYKEVDIIAIDDCSTDETVNILKSYGDKIDLIINKENLGIVKNINAAGLAINTDFVVFLGHDDVLPKRHIEIMVSEFSTEDVAVHCNSVVIDAEGKQGKIARDDVTQQAKTNNCAFELSIDNFISSCGMMHRASVFKDISGWDDSFLHYGEWLYYIRALEYGKIKYTTKTRAFYRRHETNITNTFTNSEVLKDLTKYKNKCRKLAKSKCDMSIYEQVKFFKLSLMNYLRFIKHLLVK